MTDQLRNHVATTFQSELIEIDDVVLREKVVSTWVRAMHLSGATDLAADIATLKSLAKPPYDASLGLEHIRGVVRMAISIADGLIAAHQLKLDRNIVVAGAMLHDVGKVLEKASPEKHPLAGSMVRHSVSGVHVAMLEEVPTAILHIIAYHASEGHKIQRTVECHIVATADLLSVDAMKRRELGRAELAPYIFVP